ncbi:hypothetical protein QFZ32_007207 [Streptomyces canus]|uniref:Uncharacterized protein n=1 Tax=Streptomyces canus TaxID=58343 RepID=A0AAW8FPR1_9ACTN|nr:hypothetical protein [Streptomyces canus]MDQ0911784.1 hypothetical protein [Streptomyces canus]MDQ1071767.1 hypothetical protein [Streptomyces canus]
MDGVGMDARTGIRDEACQAVLEGSVRPSRPGGSRRAQETPVGPLRGCWGVLAEVLS